MMPALETSTVKPAESLERFDDRALDDGGIGDIAFDQNDVRGFRKSARQTAFRQIESGNRPAFVQEMLCDRMTDAVRGSGDKRRPAGRVPHQDFGFGSMAASGCAAHSVQEPS